jgi:hypothetical protein
LKRARFRAGDQLPIVNGQRIVTAVDWLAQRMNFVPDQLRRQFKSNAPKKVLSLALVIDGTLWISLAIRCEFRPSLFWPTN